jgi:hypothetical protein
VKMFQLLALLRNWRNNYQAKKFKGNRAGRQRVGPTCGFTAFPEVDLGATIGTLQTGYPHIQTSSQDKEQRVHPHAATCPVAPDPTSQPKWAPRLPCVQRCRDPPPIQGWLRRRHVSHGSGPTGTVLEHHVSCGSESSLPVGRAPRCHASCGLLWAVSHKHKEKPSSPAPTTRLGCSQRTRACFQVA